MSIWVEASYVPLFDRLCPPASGEEQASLSRDLMRLLTTRNGLTITHYLEDASSVLDYGVPDLLTLSVQTETDLQQAAAVVSRAIGLFEPRLTGVTVRAQRDLGHPGRARITVSASEVIDRMPHRVNFEIALGDQGGLVTFAP